MEEAKNKERERYIHRRRQFERHRAWKRLKTKKERDIYIEGDSLRDTEQRDKERGRRRTRKKRDSVTQLEEKS